MAEEQDLKLLQLKIVLMRTSLKKNAFSRVWPYEHAIPFRV